MLDLRVSKILATAFFEKRTLVASKKSLINDVHPFVKNSVMQGICTPAFLSGVHHFRHLFRAAAMCPCSLSQGVTLHN